MGKQSKQWETLFFWGSKITADDDCSHEIKTLTPWKKSYDQPRQHIKKQRHYLPTKVRLVKAMFFPVVMYGSESWTIKKAEHGRIECFWTVVLEKTLESPLDCKEIKAFHPKGNQSWIFVGRTDFEAETPILWPADVKNWLIRKDAGKDWSSRRRGWQKMRWLDGITDQWTWVWASSGSWWQAAVHGVAKSQTLLSDWTELDLQRNCVLRIRIMDISSLWTERNIWENC